MTLIRFCPHAPSQLYDTIFLLKISTHLLARLGWFCPVVSEPVKPYFTRLLRVLTFCLGVSKIVILKENGVVKWPWEMWRGMEIRDSEKQQNLIKLK